MDIEHEYIEKLTKDLANSIDKEVLYEAMGWTIISMTRPWHIPSVSNKVIDWLKENKIEYDCWDGRIAFKEGSDATFFTLKWT